QGAPGLRRDGPRRQQSLRRGNIQKSSVRVNVRQKKVPGWTAGRRLASPTAATFSVTARPAYSAARSIEVSAYDRRRGGFSPTGSGRLSSTGIGGDCTK